MGVNTVGVDTAGEVRFDTVLTHQTRLDTRATSVRAAGAGGRPRSTGRRHTRARFITRRAQRAGARRSAAHGRRRSRRRRAARGRRTACRRRARSRTTGGTLKPGVVVVPHGTLRRHHVRRQAPELRQCRGNELLETSLTAIGHLVQRIAMARVRAAP
eukprot:2068030-Prymnesium_polylepis.2